MYSPYSFGSSLTTFFIGIGNYIQFGGIIIPHIEYHASITNIGVKTIFHIEIWNSLVSATTKM